MNDEVIVFYEACNSLSEDRKVQKKLQTDYPYHCNKNDLFYDDGSNHEGKPAKIVKAIEFYAWVRNNRKKNFPKISRDNIPKKYRYTIIDTQFTLQIPRERSCSIDKTTNIDVVRRAYRRRKAFCNVLKNEIKRLKAELTKTQEKAKRWDDLSKKKGKRIIQNPSEKNND